MSPHLLPHRTGAIERSIVALATIAIVVTALTTTDAARPVGVPLLALLGLSVRDDAGQAVKRLTDAVDRFADGEYDVDVPTDRDDDIGRLAERVETLSEELRERERAFRDERRYTGDLLDAVDDVFYVLDRDGRLRRWNERLPELTGYRDDEIDEMRAVDFFAEADREAIADAIETVFETGNARVEAPFLTNAGESIPHEFVASALEDPDGEPVAVGIGRDISARTRYERELERTTELLWQAQRVADVGGWELDVTEEPFELVGTDEFHRQLGLPPGTELDVETVLEAYHPDDRERFSTAIEDALEAGEGYDIEARLETPDGERRWMRTIGEPVVEDDEVVAVRGSMQNVTDRRERERELERTSHLLEQSQRLANVGAWELDVSGDTRDVWLSDEVASIHGISPDADVDLAEAIEFYHPEDRETIRAAVERAIEAGESYDLELRLHPADGERRWVRTIGEPVVGDDGEVVAVRGAFQDVTERTERERELERTTDRLQTVVSNVPVILFAYDADRTITFSAGKGLDALGHEPGELVGESVDGPYGWHDEIMEDVERTLDGEAVRGIREVGDVVFESTYQPVFDEDGEVTEVIGVTMDVTERHERERELERYETIIQAVGDPVYALDADGDFRFVNDAVERLTGWDPDELVGESALTVMTEADFETGRELIRELRRSDDPIRTFEMDLLTADGGAIETENSMALLPPEDGEFAGIAGVARDVTERRERERALERTRDRLQRVQRMAEIGGWELDIRGDERESMWTEELYRLHDLPPDATIDLETILERYHPDDRQRVRRAVERSLKRETGYDLEARLVGDSGDVRWVRAMGEPIFEDGELVAYRGAVQDVTERKEREFALESLHDTALELLNVETTDAIAERVVETANELLDVDGTSLYVLADETNELVPVAYTPGFVEWCGPAASVPVGADSLLWNAFATGTRTAVDDPAAIDRSTVLGDDVDRALLVPIGDHGVFVVARRAAIDEASRRLAETLAATAEAAFDRLASEASLRERDEELAARNRRLQRQVRITEIIRSIDRSLVRADGRAEIERTVCEQLVEADGIAFAWIGARDVAGDELDPRAWAGDGETYLDAASFEPGSSAEPAAAAADRNETTVAANVVDGLTHEPWRKAALGRGFQSVVAVPIAYEEYTYGVLAVYADDPNAFADLERTVFAELGENIANAINAVQTRAALHAETRTELTLRIEDGDELLSRIARKAGCRVTFEGLGARTDDGVVLFVATDGTDADAVESILDELVAVADCRLVSRSDDECRFEVTASGDPIAARLVRHGATPRSIVADGSGAEVVVDVAPTTDVRAFVEMLRDEHERVELRGRRDVERDAEAGPRAVSSLLDALTPRQLEVLRTAYHAGFFEWPRESTGQEIAETLDVSQPTVNRHVRLGQGRLLAQLFERDVDADGSDE